MLYYYAVLRSLGRSSSLAYFIRHRVVDMLAFIHNEISFSLHIHRDLRTNEKPSIIQHV